MKFIPYNDEEMRLMREACRVAATVLDRTAKFVQVGMTTYDIDMFAKKTMEELGCESTAHNYRYGNHVYPGYVCISVNEEAIHGIGTTKRTIKPGDIVSIDVATRYKGFVGDNCRTLLIEPVSAELRKFLDVTKGALAAGIAAARVGNRVGDISHAIEEFIKPHGYGIIRDYTGHGVGRDMHTEPQIPNVGKPHKGEKLRAGMTLAIEPMVNMGTYRVETAEDGWTVLTLDRKPAAHCEHTVLVTEGEPEILTIPMEETA
ncbi:MAG: type I methionyl aminopeptidase [Opitutae bacterium]|nr:type I methionyl aminopeptidase [Opitutae bacterium]